MFRNVRVGKRAAIGLSWLVLLLAGGAATGCASGGGEMNLRHVSEFVETLKEITETAAEIAKTYRG